MTAYRRNRVPGGTYFFTVNLLDRRSNLLCRHIGLLRNSVRQALAEAPFTINAWVVLPDHIHCVWTLPEDDADFSSRWHAIKAGFSRGLPPGEHRSVSREGRGERGVWQRRFWEHTIRDGRDYAAHVDYIHFNPVKHGLVQGPLEWPYSSFRRAVARGAYPASWAGSGCDLSDAGQRALSGL